VATKKKRSQTKKNSPKVRTLADEAGAWAAVSSIASAAYAFWKTFLILRRGSNSTDSLTADDDNEFMFAIRAVSWVESAHGTGAGMSAARDPMQSGNPNDSWWTQIDGTASAFDRFVRGGSGTTNYNSNELPGAVVGEAGWNSSASISNLTDPTRGHGSQSDDNGFTPTIGYWWAIPHLIWDINAGAGGRPAYACGNVARVDLKAGCVAYNGGGDPQYAAKIDAAYALFAGTKDRIQADSGVQNPDAAAAKPIVSAISDALERLHHLGNRTAEVGGSDRWFPHGITKISADVKVGNIEVSLSISGPDAPSTSRSRIAALSTNDITYIIDQRVGRKARGTLAWPSNGLSSRAVSGDSGHDAINVGTWTGISFGERPGDKPYCDSNGSCWFSVFADAFGRTGIGIHPDGGVPDATLGCIGISDPDTSAWHDALKAVGGKITCTVSESLKMIRLPDDKLFERGE
jgi:hypothetical protein